MLLGEELYKSFSISVTRDQDTDDETTPSYFGGSYCDSDDNLIVLIKNSDKKGMEDIYRRIGKHDYLKFKRCTYSLQELRILKRKLSDIYIKDETLRKNLKWNSVGINVETNRIVVFLEDISTEAINEFKRLVSDSPMITFEEMQDAENLSYIIVDSIADDGFVTRATNAVTNIHLGSSISTSGNQYIAYGSVGFRAMRGSDHGFVTAAHVVPTAGLTVSFNSQACGTSVITTRGPQADAAFIKVNYSSFYPTNVTQWTKTATASDVISYNNLINRGIVLEGGTTKKAMEATVYTIDNTRIFTKETVAGSFNFSLTNVVYAKLSVKSSTGTPQEGDSGGVIYDKSTKKVCGELLGLSQSTVGSTTTYYLTFSSADKALSALGASIAWSK